MRDCSVLGFPSQNCSGPRVCPSESVQSLQQRLPAEPGCTCLGWTGLHRTKYTSWHSLWGEPIVLKAAELVEHYPVVKRRSHKPFRFDAVFIFLSLCGGSWEADHWERYRRRKMMSSFLYKAEMGWLFSKLGKQQWVRNQTFMNHKVCNPGRGFLTVLWYVLRNYLRW